MTQEEKMSKGGDSGCCLGWLDGKQPHRRWWRDADPHAVGTRPRMKHTSYGSKSKFPSLAMVPSSCLPGCPAQVHSGRQKSGRASSSLFSLTLKAPWSKAPCRADRPAEVAVSPLALAPFPGPLDGFDSKNRIWGTWVAQRLSTYPWLRA